MKFIRKTNKVISNNFLNELLLDRQIIPENKHMEYFYPKRENLLSPLCLDNIQEGCELLKTHILNGNRIYLCIDSDVDGFTSAALVYNYLNSNLFKEYSFTITYRVPEGKEHGLQTFYSELLNEKKYDLIILPDSSSNDYEEHRVLKNMGYDILVLDHHEADHYSEDAVVINNQLSSFYENKSLSGVGVVFKFLEYFDYFFWKQTHDNEESSYESWIYEEFLDLVALGEISDMMNMNTLENRYICDYGLSHIKNGFFKELVDKQSFSLGAGALTQIGVAFYITPLINALIRVGSDLEKERLFEAFINPDKEVPSTKRGEKGLMETIATQSARNCVNAKSRQKREMDKAIELLDVQISDNCLNENKILILNADELNVSNTLTGLIAMGIAAKYKKPTLLGRTSPDGYLKGSIRGREESELKNFRTFLLSSGYMEYVEGHANAAGYAVKTGNLDKLQNFANKELEEINFNEGFYEADFIVNGNCSYLSELIEDLEQGKELWGQRNEQPIVIVENVNINTSEISIIGSYKDTLKFVYNGITYVKFKAKALIDELFLNPGKINITIAGRTNVNEWGGRKTPQIMIDEIEVRSVTENDF